MLKKFFGLLVSFMVVAQAHASVSVAPTKLEIDGNRFRRNYITTSIDLRGDTDKMTRLRVSAGYFKANSEGKIELIDDLGKDPHDISRRVKFIPSEFNVLPNRTQKLRVNILGLNQLPDGESRAILYIEDVDTKEYNIHTGKAGVGAQLVVKTRIGVPLYIDKGKYTKTGNMEYLKVVEDKDGLFTECKINSTGNSRIKYEGKMQIVDGKKLIGEYKVSGNMVHAGTSIIAKDKINFEDVEKAGTYTLRSALYYTNEKGKKVSLTQETPLVVSEEQLQLENERMIKIKEMSEKNNEKV